MDNRSKENVGTPAAIAEEALREFFRRVSRRDMQVMGEFAPTGDVLLVGSEHGELAVGLPAIAAFFQRLFERERTFSWNTQRIDATRSADVLWFFAEGHMVVDGPAGRASSPYCIGGVLRQQGDRWLWSLYHGSEPVPSP